MVITTSGMCPLAKRRARRWVREEPDSLALFTRNRRKKSRKLIFLGLSAPDQQTTTITSKSFATKWKIGQPKNGDQFPHFCSFHVSRFRSFVVDLPRRSRDDRGYETQRDLFSPMEWSSSLSWKIHRIERMTKGPRKRWCWSGAARGALQECVIKCLRRDYTKKWKANTRGCENDRWLSRPGPRERGGRDCEDWRYSGPGTRWVGNVWIGTKCWFCLNYLSKIHFFCSSNST